MYGMFTYIWLICIANVGMVNIVYIDPMGMDLTCITSTNSSSEFKKTSVRFLPPPRVSVVLHYTLGFPRTITPSVGFVDTVFTFNY